MIPYVLTNNSLTVFVNYRPYTVDDSHINFDKLLLIVTGEVEAPSNDDLIDLLSIKKAISAMHNRISISGEAICVDGVPTHSYAAQRIMEFYRQEYDVAPWLAFLDRLYNNPSRQVVTELFQWMEVGRMPVTSDGKFLAYKKVQGDYTSYHPSPDGTHLSHIIGEIVEMPRNYVDDIRTNTCSTGLHACSWGYLSSYHGGKGRVLVLEIDPADVVSIPHDYQFQKMRACRYKVIGEVESDEFTDTLVYDDADDYPEFDDEDNEW